MSERGVPRPPARIDEQNWENRAVNWTSVRQPVATLARLGLGAVWIWAGWDKLQDPRAFIRAVRAYEATPEWLTSAIGYGLPVLEVSIGILLVVGLAVRAAAAVSAFLLVVFAAGILQASARGLKLECGCFGGGGSTDKTTYLLDIARDAGLLVVAVFLIIWPLSYFSLESALVDRSDLPMPSAKRVRRDPKALKKYEVMRQARRREQASKERYITAVVSIVVVLVAFIGIAVQSNRAKIDVSVGALNASTDTGVTVGQKTAPVTLDIYEDFQCPVCEAFEASTGADITKLIAAGTIKVNYHPMAFLDAQSSGNRYSSRAANASICASQISVDDFAAYHNVLFGKDAKGQKVQPEEGSDGRTDAQLEDYLKVAVPAVDATDTTSFAQCVAGETYKQVIQKITDNASKRGVVGTPTVYVQNSKLSTVTTASVLSAISAALGKAGKSTVLPTGSATPTASGSASGTASASATATKSP